MKDPNLGTRGQNAGAGTYPSMRLKNEFGNEINSIVTYSWAVEPTNENKFSDKSDKSDKKSKSMGLMRLVQKLKCTPAASRRNQEKRGRQRSSKESPSVSSQQRPVRPVMITVKNTGSQYAESEKFSTDPSLHSWTMDVVGPGCSNASFSSPCSPVFNGPTNLQKTPQSSFSTKSNLRSISYTSLKPPMTYGSTARTVQATLPTDSLATRKELWRQGLQDGWEDDGDQPSHASGDDSAGFMCSPVGGSFGYETDVTTEMSSAGSDSISQSRDKNKHVLGKPARRGHSSLAAKGTNSGHLWSIVAEDIGIFAGLLLSDGKACFGTIADITRETVADTCQAEGRT